jgi:hypothetical protein
MVLFTSGSTSDGPSPKRARVAKSVTFAYANVRCIPLCDSGGGERAGNRADMELPPDVADTVKATDGPAIETECVGRMIAELLITRDPSVVSQTLQVICDKGSLKTMQRVRDRVGSLVGRLRVAGRVAILPSCMSLHSHSLPVLEWLLDCANRAADYMESRRDADAVRVMSIDTLCHAVA